MAVREVNWLSWILGTSENWGSFYLWRLLILNCSANPCGPPHNTQVSLRNGWQPATRVPQVTQVTSACGLQRIRDGAGNTTAGSEESRKPNRQLGREHMPGSRKQSCSLGRWGGWKWNSGRARSMICGTSGRKFGPHYSKGISLLLLCLFCTLRITLNAQASPGIWPCVILFFSGRCGLDSPFPYPSKIRRLFFPSQQSNSF